MEDVRIPSSFHSDVVKPITSVKLLVPASILMYDAPSFVEVIDNFPVASSQYAYAWASLLLFISEINEDNVVFSSILNIAFPIENVPDVIVETKPDSASVNFDETFALYTEFVEM